MQLMSNQYKAITRKTKSNLFLLSKKIIKNNTARILVKNSLKQIAAVFEMYRIIKKSEIESEKVILESFIPNAFFGCFIGIGY